MERKVRIAKNEEYLQEHRKSLDLHSDEESDACFVLNGREYPSPREVIDNVQANVIENENEAEEF